MTSTLKAFLLILKTYGISNRVLRQIYVVSADSYKVKTDFPMQFVRERLTFLPSKSDDVLLNEKAFERFLLNEWPKVQKVMAKTVEKIWFRYDEDIPNWIKNVEDESIFFFLAGNTAMFRDDYGKTVGVIGSRHLNMKHSDFGKQAIRDFEGKGYLIVSGLAEGADTLAHTTALEDGLETAAFLPTKFEDVYPKENNLLADDIKRHGGLFTVAAPGSKTYRSNFLIRNEYLTSFVDEVLVIQATLNSGTMDSIKRSIKKNKPVWFLRQDDIDVNEYLRQLGAKEYGEING
ncbi:DNA-processing protein DprA [Weissella confusa]|uniref:DNA-processing protein DprA n=1 Tax=Weissella confusa TaxID=1583 RepID=UPI0024081F84|nr:DNA-processing protein DprA [Weissella confusa]WEY47498.1 DNA-processing protein DprA [Weissella confusa]